IFRPGFSTSATVTDLSGRGVGTDVVREHVRRLGGGVSVGGAPGAGTRFTITVPLTLATTQAVLVEQGDQLFALPATTVERGLRARDRELVTLEGRRAVAIDGRAVPVVDLADVLERPRPPRPFPADGWRTLFVLAQDGRRVAFLTDRLVGAQEIVVKRLGWPLRRVRNVAGATVLASGRTAVILEPSDLLRSASRLIGAVRPAPSA